MRSLPIRLALAAAVTTSFTPAVAAASAAFPLRPSPNGHYFVDQAGRPFLVHGDSPWESLWRLTREETLEYLDQRMGLGFNTILFNLLPDSLGDGHPRTPNRYGVQPFRDPNDFATANPAYFDHAEWYVQEAGRRGLLVMMFPCYLGLGYTWADDLKANGPERAAAYGRFLAARFAKYPNLMWIMGGDRDPGDVKPEHDALAEALHRGAPHQLITFHGRETSSATLYNDAAWLGFNSTYSYSETYLQTHEDWQRTPRRPTVMSESGYEREANDSRFGTPQRVRRQAYWTLIAGSAGHFYGSAFWHLKPGWRESLDWPGARQMAHVRAFFEALPWWELEPGFERQLIAAGNGYYGSNDDYILAAATPDRRVAVLYMPAPRRMRLDLSTFPAPVRARWFDPTTGAYSDAAVDPLPNRALETWLFPPPRESDGDWALVLEASGTGTVAALAPALGYHELRIYHALPGKARAVVEQLAGPVGELKRRHGLNPVGLWEGVGEEGEPVVVELCSVASPAAVEAGSKALHDDRAYELVLEASESRHGRTASRVDHLRLRAPSGAFTAEAASSAAAAPALDLRVHELRPGREADFLVRWRNDNSRVYRRQRVEPLGYWEAADAGRPGAFFVTLMAAADAATLELGVTEGDRDGEWWKIVRESEAGLPWATGRVRYRLRPVPAAARP